MFEYLATDENRADPNYSDVCSAETGVLCTYCCIVSKGECSRDMRACHPVLIENRETENFYMMFIIILGVVCGCPLIASLMRCCLSSRFCLSYYPTTQGVTLMELLCRCSCICCFRFDQINKKPSA